MEFKIAYCQAGSKKDTVCVSVKSNDDSKLNELLENAVELFDFYDAESKDRKVGRSGMTYDETFKWNYTLRRALVYAGGGSVVITGGNTIRKFQTDQWEHTAAVAMLFSFIVEFPDDDKLDGNNMIFYHSNYNHSHSYLLYRYTNIPSDLDITLNFKEAVYTNISEISPITCPVGCVGIKFSAKKNGGEQAIYDLFAENNIGGDRYDTSGKQPRPYIKLNYDAYHIFVTPSVGIIQEKSVCRYIGSQFCKFFDAKEEEVITYNDIGEDFTHIEIKNYSTLQVANLFYEQNGSDLTIRVLINGRLHKKISKTDESVKFYYTKFRNIRPGEESDEEDKTIIEFKNTNGTYICSPYVNDDDEEVDAAVSLTLPKLPAADCDSGALFDFYMECRKALEECDIVAYKGNKIFKNGNGESYFKEKYEDAEITAIITKKTYFYKKLERDFFFEGFNLPDILGLCVDDITFTKDGKTIVLMPRGNFEMDVKISDEEGRHDEGGYRKFCVNADDYFKQNSSFNRDWLEIIKNFECYKNYAFAALDSALYLLTYGDDYIEKTLYPNGMTPDKSVIKKAEALYRGFKREGKIPNLAIMGQAGTGKTYISGNIAKAFGKDGVVEVTPSDIKGAYLGHTKFMVVKKIYEALIQDKILFIDEAYNIMQDKFGKEAIDIILPVMTGDMTVIQAEIEPNRGSKEKYDIDLGEKKIVSGKEIIKKGHILKLIDDKIVEEESKDSVDPLTIPIWFGGYENEIRLMINENQGLYRRLEKICIKTPTTSELLEELRQKLQKYADTHAETQKEAVEKAKRLLDYLKKESNEKSVRDFFGWGTQPQNSKFFANHAGVNKFINDCLNEIDLSGEIGSQIEEIITATKYDIKRQLAAIKDNGSTDALDTINVITDIDTRFKDIVGCKEPIAYMKSIIEMLVNRSVYEDNRINVPKGALMEGLPGVGKTFIARAMAGELQELFQNAAPDKRFGFIAVSGSELGSRPASYIKSIFSAAEEYDACILFIDECDAIAKHRNHNTNYNKYLELIKQMDGIEKSSNVFVLAATNAPQNLDPAFVRSGRIDKKLAFDLPNAEERTEFAKRAIEKRIKTLVDFDSRLDHTKSIKYAAQLTGDRMRGCTPGDIDNAINSAFIVYRQFKHIKDSLMPYDKKFFLSYPFIEEKDGELVISAEKGNIQDGEQLGDLTELFLFIDEEIARKNMGTLNQNTRETRFDSSKNNGSCSSTAIHEVGHALTSVILGEPFDLITTLSRGDSLGYVSHHDIKMNTKSDYINRIRICMGGRISEEIIFGKDNISPGAAYDMQTATNYARKMFELFGFSEEFGFMALSVPTGGYLGANDQYTCSEAFRLQCDNAVKDFLKEIYSGTLGMFEGKKELILKLAETVFNRESMTGSEFTKLYHDIITQQ